MNTQSHAIVNLFLLHKRFGKNLSKNSNINVIIVFGSILPDLPIVFFFIWYTWIVPTPQHTIWRTLYFTDAWQIFFDLFNSIPFFLVIAALAYMLAKEKLFIFCLANLLHFVEDFFVHREDGHAHFFPFSNYKFMSPISYWDGRSFGQYFSIFELILTVILSVYVFGYLKTWWGRALLVFANILLLLNHGLWFFLFSVFR